MNRNITGWHMTGILVTFFGVVVAVNLLMASFATSTFGGIQVENSYVASQNFNRWLDEAEQAEGLGWQADASLQADGRVRVIVSGPGEGAELTGVVRHPVGREADRALDFTRAADGTFLSTEPLPRERWILRLQLADGEAMWRREVRL